MFRALADTGALLALLDRDDRWHQACVDVFSQFQLPLLTTTAVLTELFHLVGDSPREVDAAWFLLTSGAVSIQSVEDDELPTLQRLMKKYQDRPMDFADATLVLLAEREDIRTVFTVDHNDFFTYRIRGRQAFRVLPAAERPTT